MARSAYTWALKGDETDPDDHHDRIDFAFAKAPGLNVPNAWIAGESGPRTDLAADPRPSDHRATLAEISF